MPVADASELRPVLPLDNDDADDDAAVGEASADGEPDDSVTLKKITEKFVRIYLHT